MEIFNSGAIEKMFKKMLKKTYQTSDNAKNYKIRAP